MALDFQCHGPWDEKLFVFLENLRKSWAEDIIHSWYTPARWLIESNLEYFFYPEIQAHYGIISTLVKLWHITNMLQVWVLMVKKGQHNITYTTGFP